MNTGKDRTEIETGLRKEKTQKINELMLHEKITEAERVRIESNITSASLNELESTINVLSKWIREREKAVA